jgi:hypothetical protein
MVRTAVTVHLAGRTERPARLSMGSCSPSHPLSLVLHSSKHGWLTEAFPLDDLYDGPRLWKYHMEYYGRHTSHTRTNYKLRLYRSLHTFFGFTDI